MIATTMQQTLLKEPAGGRKSPSATTKKWCKLFVWIILLWSFIFFLAPWLQRESESIRQLGTYIEESGIDAGAIYYTEVEEVGDADLAIRNTFRFYLDEQKLKNR